MDRGSTGVERDGDSGEAGGGRVAGLRRRLPSRLRLSLGLFSVRSFVLVATLATVAMLAGTVVPLPGGRFLLLFGTAFGYGLVVDGARYPEWLAAGAAAGGVGFVLSVVLGGALLPVLAGYGAEIAGLGVTAGALAALAGHYFGRDLRSGWGG